MSISAARKFEENEQFDKAYEEYKKIHAKKPDDIDTLQNLGHLASMLDKQEEATDYYNKILELDATNTLAYEQLMDVYVHTNRYKYYVSRGNLHVLEGKLSHAISDFKKALSKTQSEVEMNTSRFVLANLYEQTGKFHQAIDEYLRILDTENTNELVYINLAKLYLKQDALSSAIDILERAKKDGYDTENIKEHLAELYLRAGDGEKSRELTQNDLVKVRSYLDEGENARAYELLEKIKDENLKNPQYHSLLAQYYFNKKEYEKSLESVEKYSELEHNSPLTYQMRAMIYDELKHEYEAHLNWGKFNLYKGDRDVALNDFLSAHQYKEDDVELTQDIAELLDDSGDVHHAAEFYEKLLNLDNKNKKAIKKVAEYKESIGELKASAEALENLYLLEDKNLSVIKKIGSLYEKIKNKEKALEFYKRYISVSPVDDDYDLMMQKVARLENTEMVEDDGILNKIMKLFSK